MTPPNQQTQAGTSLEPSTQNSHSGAIKREPERAERWPGEFSGEPNPAYAETAKLVSEKLAKQYGKPSSVVVPSENETEEGKALRERLKKPAPQIEGVRGATNRLDHWLKQVDTLRRPKRRQSVSFEEAQTLVRHIYATDIANREEVSLWTPEILEIVDDVTKYFIGDSTSSIPLHRCLFVYGPNGVGKTYLFKVMQLLCSIVQIRQMHFRMVSTARVMRAVKVAKSIEPIYKLEKGHWLLDELGAEKKVVKVYADDEDPIDQILKFAYENFIESGQMLHITTNKTPDDMEELYGTRAYDRFKESHETILFDGLSLRDRDNLH